MLLIRSHLINHSSLWSIYLLAYLLMGAPSIGYTTEQLSSTEEVKVSNEMGAVPVPSGPFDLQICFEQAILHSETLGLKEEDVRVAQAQYWQAIGSVLPKIHSITTESLQNNTGLGNVAGSSNSTGSLSSGRDNFSSAINIKQPIFSGFRDIHTIGAAKASIEAKKYNKVRARQLLYLDVADVFYQVLMYEGDLQILDEIHAALLKRVDELQRRIRLGKSRTSELLMAKTDLEDILATAEKVRGLLDASRELMSFLTTIPAQDLKLKTSQILPNIDLLESYLAFSNKRPDVLAAGQNEVAEKKQLSATQGQHWPTISAEGNYFIKQHPDFHRDWNVFLTCDLPIFEGGLIEARIREHKALVKASELNLEQLRRTVDRDVRTAYHNFISSIEQVAHLKEAHVLAEENYRAQKEDYNRGIVGNLEVLDALKQKHQIHQQLHDVEMTAQANFIHLHVMAGKAVPNGKAP